MNINKMLEKNYIRLIIFALVSIFVLMIGSSCSFLYKFNDWADLNYFITMGKGILNGKVIYKDMFEQKGPFLYFVFSGITLFKNPYIATYVLECILMTTFALISYKIARRYTDTKKSVISVILLIVITVSLEGFNKGGGSVEEFTLPILAYFMYLFLQIVEEKRGLTKVQAITSGILFGIVFWTKFTLCIMLAIVYVIWFIKQVQNKRVKDTIVNTLLTISGMFISTLPVLIYFVHFNAVQDLWFAYFYANIFLYSGTINLLVSLGSLFISNFLILPIIICGYIIYKKSGNWDKSSFVYSLVFLGLTTLSLICTVGFRYYFLQLVPFMTMPIAMIVDWLSKKKLFNLDTEKKRIFVNVMSCVLVVIYVFVFTNSNMQWGLKDDYYPQIQVAKKINELNSNDPTLFCYKIMDGGFYNTTGIVPSEKYFCYYNFKEEKFPELFDAMRTSVSEQHCEFVVTKKTIYESDISLFENKYEIIEEYQYDYKNSKYITDKSCFVLLRRI